MTYTIKNARADFGTRIRESNETMRWCLLFSESEELFNLVILSERFGLVVALVQKEQKKNMVLTRPMTMET